MIRPMWPVKSGACGTYYLMVSAYSYVVAVLTLTRTTKSVGAGQAPVALDGVEEYPPQ